MKCRHLAGTSASIKIADTGQAGSQAAQSMQVTGSMYICNSSGPPCMQSTGHTSTQASSFAPMHGSQITYVKLDAPCLTVVPVGVDFCEVMPLFRQIIFGKDRLHGAGWFARATVYAFIRVNVEQFRSFKLRLILSWMNAIDRANVYTCRVLCPDAGFRNNVSHLKA